MGEVIILLSLVKNCLCSLVPEITSKLVLSFLIAKMVYVPLFPQIFCLCSPIPRFNFSHVPENPLEGLILANVVNL